MGYRSNIIFNESLGAGNSTKKNNMVSNIESSRTIIVHYSFAIFDACMFGVCHILTCYFMPPVCC